MFLSLKFFLCHRPGSIWWDIMCHIQPVYLSLAHSTRKWIWLLIVYVLSIFVGDFFPTLLSKEQNSFCSQHVLPLTLVLHVNVMHRGTSVLYLNKKNKNQQQPQKICPMYSLIYHAENTKCKIPLITKTSQHQLCKRHGLLFAAI